VGPFRLVSEYTSEQAKAQETLEVLLRIRLRMQQPKQQSTSEEEATAGDADLEARFRAALSEEDSLCQPFRLRFYAQVPAKYWVGRSLTTPTFPLAGLGLERGLMAWRRLSDARARVHSGRSNRYSILQHHGPKQMEAAWVGLRSVYFDICVECGQSPSRVSARLKRWEAAHRPYVARRSSRWTLCKSSMTPTPARARSGHLATAGSGSAETVRPCDRPHKRAGSAPQRALCLLEHWTPPEGIVADTSRPISSSSEEEPKSLKRKAAY